MVMLYMDAHKKYKKFSVSIFYFTQNTQSIKNFTN